MRSRLRKRAGRKGEAIETEQRKQFPWTVALLLLAVTVIFPAAAYCVIEKSHPQFLRGLQEMIIVLYSIASVMSLWEAFSALRLPKPPEPTGPLPRCTALIAAYLPNEQNIILETLQHMLNVVDVAAEDFQILLAYNTPVALPVEEALQEIARHDPRLTLLRAEDSHSKAENVNAALPYATGEIIAIYDADHLPEAGCFHKAWRWLSNGYQVVQGRCIIRNYNDNWLTRTVAVEFDTIYATSHQGRSTLSGTGIFGGSNGYWCSGALRAVGMNGAMLTEDIDSSVRTLLAGRKIIHDRSIRSFELAPARPLHWYFQRKRWSQGWLEVTLVYQQRLLQTKYLTGLQKFIWFYLLGWREVYPVLAMQIYSLSIAAWITHFPAHWFQPGIYLTTSLFNLTSGLVLLCITACCASREGRHGLGAWYFVYGLFSLVYTSVKTMVTLIAQYAHFSRDTAWVTTPRSSQTAPRAEENNS